MNKSPSRNKYIQLIHVAKNQLHMDDDSYRALLERLTDKRSCTNLNKKQLDTVYREMKRLGFKATKHGKTIKPSQDKVLLMDKLEALLADNKLHWNYAHGMAKKMFNVDRVEWLKHKQLHSLVAALQIHVNRHKTQ